MATEIRSHPQFDGIYLVTMEDGSRRLATLNLVPGKHVYGEELVTFGDKEYRLWNPYRSKLAATILKGQEVIPIRSRHKILYLGAASGTTASHISDIVGNAGHVYCIEFAVRTIRELINNVCVLRPNMSPIMADACLPGRYLTLVEKVNNIYCDIAQPEQAKVLADNADLFLVKNGWVLLAVKAQSIDVTKDPAIVYEQEIRVMKNRGFRINEITHLEPYDKAHAMIVASR